ncbi:hypothetical protein Btru_027931 [Bulinus truncatus]|nr:hypothetical protein Btru_027931 [Bulinus truncatus]
MRYLLFLVLLVPFVLADGDDDPTQLCLPNQFQSSVYDFNNQDTGVAAGDFTKNLTVLTFVKANYRLLFDLTTMKGYLISNNSCTSFDMDPSQAIFQCLPATATPLSNTTTRLGLDAQGINIKGYQVIINDPVAIRIAVTDTKPVIPVLRQVIGTNSKFAGDVLFFVNTVLQIDPQLFVFPLVCPDITVVG